MQGQKIVKFGDILYSLLFGKESQVAYHLVRMEFEE